MRRTSVFEFLRDFTQEEKDKLAIELLDINFDLSSDSPWAAWHARAEAVLFKAAALGAAVVRTKSERPRGSPPSARPVAQTKLGHETETVALRRLKRLFRAALQQLRCQEGGPLAEHQLKHWRGALRDGLIQSLPVDQHAALSMASSAITVEDRRVAATKAEGWRRSFYAGAAVKQAKTVINPPLVSDGDVQDFVKQWQDVWCDADGQQCAQWAANWRILALEHGLPRPGPRPLQLPDDTAFHEASLGASGGAGWDGWCAQDVKWLAKNAPVLVRGLHALLSDAVSRGGDVGLITDLASWRYVGIPKKAGPAFRPIAVGSIWLRVWHRCLLSQLPEPSVAQWAGRAGESAVTATADWMSCKSRAGAELDLEKAFDLVPHSVAAEALDYMGVNRHLVDYLRKIWAGARICSVEGELAPIEGTIRRGLPAGDPLSPALLDVVLRLWQTVLVREAPRVRTWLFMDDRSIKAAPGLMEAAAVEAVDAAVAATVAFDSALGLRENMGKRQRWVAGGPAVEHLGFNVVFAEGGETSDAVPRGGWPEKEWRRLGLIPGTISLRAKLATTLIMPKWNWAVPLIDPPTVSERLTINGLIKTRCTWWCASRFFADNLMIHPVMSWAIRTITACGNTRWASVPRAQTMVRKAAECISLDVESFSERGLWLRPSPTMGAEGRRAICSAIGRDASWRVVGAFPVDGQAGAHWVRASARATLLQRIVGARRFDAAGADKLDLETSTSPTWRSFERSLNDRDKTRIAVLRGGAVWSPTRRYLKFAPPVLGSQGTDLDDYFLAHGICFRPDFQTMRRNCQCPLCGANWASMYHLAARCPGLAEARRCSGLDDAFWQSVPRLTACTLWAVRGMSAKQLVAVARVALAVLRCQADRFL